MVITINISAHHINFTSSSYVLLCVFCVGREQTPSVTYARLGGLPKEPECPRYTWRIIEPSRLNSGNPHFELTRLISCQKILTTYVDP